VVAPAKINLHLEVLGLRADGYHELAMLMQSLDLADRLSLQPTADGPPSS
jgi:4-diphosphocytidyl-2-C-methyl-D-erythritol kinase